MKICVCFHGMSKPPPSSTGISLGAGIKSIEGGLAFFIKSQRPL